MLQQAGFPGDNAIIPAQGSFILYQSFAEGFCDGLNGGNGGFELMADVGDVLVINICDFLLVFALGLKGKEYCAVYYRTQQEKGNINLRQIF